MKALLTLSIFIGIIATGLLLWWETVDGTRFSRAMEDLRVLSPDDLKKRQVSDPWGKPYLKVEVRSGEHTAIHVISQGPDGHSYIPGHDSDDITRWKSRFEWLADRHPVRWITCVLLISGGFSLGLGAMISARCRSGKTNPQKARLDNLP